MTVALIVRAGWPGHRPVEATETVIPFLERNGFEVVVRDTPEAYADAALMERVGLIVQAVSMHTISDEALAGLLGAVRRGVGFAGWHGGIVDSYRDRNEYLQLVGGAFAAHPSPLGDAAANEADYFRDYSIELTDLGREHLITSGLDDFTLFGEQYWVLSDDYCDVLATTTAPVQPGAQWTRPIVSPAIWTRQWGKGRVFVATPGHRLEELQSEPYSTIIHRGLLWASGAEDATVTMTGGVR